MIELSNIYKRFPLHSGLFARYGAFVHALNGVSLTITKQECYGLVGESGSGKTTLARIIASMYLADRGTVTIDQQPITQQFSTHPSVQYIFQDPARSLNPRLTIYSILTCGLNYPPYLTKQQKIDAAEAALVAVGLEKNHLFRKPIEFSGGQRQRIAIARALIHKPSLLICDEVVSALDVSIRTQIINLLLMLKQQYSITILFISHDLAVVGYISDRIGVLWNGRLVEEATSPEMNAKRYHPYTQQLYEASSYANSHSTDSPIDNRPYTPPKQSLPQSNVATDAVTTAADAPPTLSYTNATPTHRYLKDSVTHKTPPSPS